MEHHVLIFLIKIIRNNAFYLVYEIVRDILTLFRNEISVI
jgi:hypothetical protein